jgi:sec-independent protein translocase protein TatC
VILLVRSGLISVEKLAEARSYVILGSAFVAAIITPPDAISMLALFIPMCILFEVGLFLARFVGTRQKDVESRPSSIDPTGKTP